MQAIPPAPTEFEIVSAKRLMLALGKEAAIQLDKTPMDPDMAYSKATPALTQVSGWMLDQGWAIGGQGLYAIVYVKGGLALKLGVDPSDACYIYAAWCRQHPKDAGVITVHGIERGTTCYVVLMDRYYEIVDPDHLLKDEMEEAKRAIMGWGDAPPTYLSGETAQKLREFFTGIATFDLHERNMMMDRYGTLVITDPIADAVSDRNGTSSRDSAWPEPQEVYTSLAA